MAVKDASRPRVNLRRWVGCLLYGVAVAAHAGAPTIADMATRQLYAQEAFYRQAEPPEQIFIGRLQRHGVTLGPGNRPHPYQLLWEGGRLEIYATPSAEKMLAPYVGRQVRIQGKAIDLSGEGYGRELWIGTIAPE